MFIKRKKNTITTGKVIGPYSEGCVLVASDDDGRQIICYDDNKDTDEVDRVKANDKVKIEISAIDPNRGWIIGLR